MTTAEPIASLTITVFARHSEECPKHDEPQWKRCKCRKSLYIREGGKTQYVSAKTRSWEQAERVAQAERDKRDPVKLKLQNIAESEAVKQAAEASKLKRLDEALDQWLNGMKKPGSTSVAAYRSTTRTILRWAERSKLQFVSDLTPFLLGDWYASWSPDAAEKHNRMALTTQAALLTRVKAFFRWATAMEYTPRNPTSLLKAITPEESQTWPLTRAQFEELMAATDLPDADARYSASKVGRHLRALFLVQRWTGLRVGDVLALPRSALNGNRLTALIQKKKNRKPTAAWIEVVLPDHVVDALTSLPPHPEVHPDYFFWRRTCRQHTNTNKWLRRIRKLNAYLAFKDEQGQPLEFKSHMLRDTFAVEMLLAGVPLEKVSKLLTHESVTMTERYYAKWTKARKLQLEDEVVAAMRRMGAKVRGM